MDHGDGSGTIAAVAARLGRRFVADDRSDLAIEIASKRLGEQGTAFDALRAPPDAR